MTSLSTDLLLVVDDTRWRPGYPGILECPLTHDTGLEFTTGVTTDTREPIRPKAAYPGTRVLNCDAISQAARSSRLMNCVSAGSSRNS
eukprot:3402075-Rhodomonas_salina.1